MGLPVVEISDLWFSYNGRNILQDVSMSVDAGEFMAIIGPNGGGKTTLFKLMLGLLKPGRGIIRVFGLQPHEAAPRIGYVPQEVGINKEFPITVEEVVLMGRMRGGGGFRRYSRADRAAAAASLEQAGIGALGRRRLAELSGGQRQRVMMARALVAEPELLLLDEPTANVDQHGQAEFYSFLKQLNKRSTIIVVSHDMLVLSGYVRSVACVNRDIHFHEAPRITPEALGLETNCPVDMFGPGWPQTRLMTMPKDK